jgi:hypothetical protein
MKVAWITGMHTNAADSRIIVTESESLSTVINFVADSVVPRYTAVLRSAKLQSLVGGERPPDVVPLRAFWS